MAHPYAKADAYPYSNTNTKAYRDAKAHADSTEILQ